MKIIFSIIFGLIITTLVVAQTLRNPQPDLAETTAYIKMETLGGKLDFRSFLSDSVNTVIYYKGVGFNKNDYYVFLWGQSVGELGLPSSENAAKLWEEIHDQKLTMPQKTALRIGFEKKIK
ncbi:MAG: hypothetical protein WA874_07115 [Chryseosolibacter sp.]